MTTIPSPISVAGHDLVCEAIEGLLNDLQSAGRGSLVRTNLPHSVQLRFGELRAKGETYEIALVRLANAMFEDARYRGRIMVALRGR